MDGQPARPRGVAFHDSSLLVVAQGAAQSGIVVYNVANRKPTDALFAGQLDSPEHVAVRLDGALAISQADGSVVVGNVATAELTERIPTAEGQRVFYVGFVDPTGDLLVVYQDSQSIGQPNEFTSKIFELR